MTRKLTATDPDAGKEVLLNLSVVFTAQQKYSVIDCILAPIRLDVVIHAKLQASICRLCRCKPQRQDRRRILQGVEHRSERLVLCQLWLPVADGRQLCVQHSGRRAVSVPLRRPTVRVSRSQSAVPRRLASSNPVKLQRGELRVVS